MSACGSGQGRENTSERIHQDKKKVKVNFVLLGQFLSSLHEVN